jgi:hypothetical protein
MGGPKIEPTFSPETEAQPQLPSKRWLGSHLEDLPMPHDFALDYKASYLNVTGREARVADLRYTGPTPITEVLSFLQFSVPKAGWSSISLTGGAIKTLRYAKDNEECVLIVRKGDGGESVILVYLHPRQ